MEKINIAIAEDNSELAGLMAEHLGNESNMEIVGIVHNGKACLEMLKSRDVDVLLLDNIMPYLDGIGVLDAIKQEKSLRHLDVIMLSAFGQDSLMSQAAQHGAAYFIMKPFELDRLVQQINHIAQNRLAEQEGPEEIEDQVTHIIKEVGVPPHINGYMYLKEAVTIVREHPEALHKVTKCLYPGIAETFRTTPTRVERSIRHAIESVWNRGETDHLSGIFGYSAEHLKSKPTNSEFIAMVVDSLHRDRHRGN